MIRFENKNSKMSDNLFAEKSLTRKRVESSNVLKYASDNRDEGFFNDITVQIENLSIPASRMILACHSRFFERMFKTNMREKYEPIVEIQGAKGPAVKAIIDYFYTQSININSNSVMDLLTAADYLLVDDVKKFCYEFLESIVEPRNSIKILKAAEMKQNKAVLEWIYRYIQDHLDEIALTNDFLSLSKKEFIATLTGGIGNNVEESKCKALFLWVKHEEARKVNFENLFLHMENLCKLSIEFHKNVLLKEQLIIDNVLCRQRVLTAFQELLESKSAPFDRPSHSKVISIGREKSPQIVHDVYNIQGQPLLNYPELPRNQNSCKSLKFNDIIFCLGGKAEPPPITEILNDVW